jgi:hypothetical protein
VAQVMSGAPRNCCRASSVIFGRWKMCIEHSVR